MPKFTGFSPEEAESTLRRIFSHNVRIPKEHHHSLAFGVHSSERTQAIAAAIDAIVDQKKSSRKSSHTLCILQDAALISMVEPVVDLMDPANSGDRGKSWPGLMQRLIDFIDALQAPISPKDVADHFGISIRTLQMIFQRHLNLTPHAYIKRARLEAIRREVEIGDGTESVNGIARRWGFSNPSRFNAEYIEAFGRRPRRLGREGK